MPETTKKKDKELKVIEKKRQITDALKRCLNERVYSQITIQDIANEAGFSKGGLLHYFPSKEDIYIALIDDIFSGIEKEHEMLLAGRLESSDKASLTALYGIETFMQDRQNTKIMINLVLYSFEDKQIMERMKVGSQKMRQLYEDIITGSRKETPSRRKTDLDPKFISRIVQMLVLLPGVFEQIDSIEMDSNDLAHYIVTLLK